MSEASPTDAAAASTALDPSEVLLCDVALALHQAGAPAHRLEDVVVGLARRLEVEARIFSTPTSIYAGFGPPAAARTTLLRVQPGALDLGRLDAVDEVVRRLADGELEVADARATLAAVAGAGRRYPLAVTLAASAVASGAVAVLFGGSLADLGAGAAVALAVGAVVEACLARPGTAPLADLLGAATSGALAGLAARLVPGADVGLLTLAGVIALVPGLSLTTAMAELGTRHLASGTARLGGVGATFASLALGAVAGNAVWWGWPTGGVPAPPLGPVADVVALAASLPAFTVLLQARARDLGVIALTAVCGYATARSLAGVLLPPFDATAGALVVGLVANGLARLRDRPAAVPLVPALFLLVPGSVGFRGLIDLLAADTAGGLESAIRATLTAIGLAAGIVVANVALPPRRPL